jgi:alanyl-tRNA synthetase
MHMTAADIKTSFIAYFKKQGHAIVPSSSLVPDDPSVLLTSAGMQQFKNYYTGAADPIKDFGSRSAVSIQKSFRTSDIDEVGDATHNTFFEMLGNFSFGGYFKKEAITYAHEYITKELGIPISYVSIFQGSDSIPKDGESRRIWETLGITDIREEGMEDVFWGPTGISGPCGPATEIYCTNAAGDDIEVWNIVFNQYVYPGTREELLAGAGEKKLEPLKTPGVDTGMGMERLAMIAQRAATIFETDLFMGLLACLPAELETRKKRIIADHLRASVFLIADGIEPSNKAQGYILRRLLRRVLAMEQTTDISLQACEDVLLQAIQRYSEWYPELSEKKNAVINTFFIEQQKFARMLNTGLKELSRVSEVNAPAAFRLYESFGLPFEVIKEEAGERALQLTRADFEQEFRNHQERSRAGTEKKFGGHGLVLDTGELKAANAEELQIVTRLHTATHLLHAALRMVLGEDVKQMGSDITAERTRFDFSFPRKVTPEELTRVEAMVNDVIKNDYSVEAKEMPYEEALKTGALHFFKEKYPERVTVYSVIRREPNEVFSKEFCGGPHVTHTGNIGHFIIRKEESSSAGIRRIRATLETRD